MSTTYRVCVRAKCALAQQGGDHAAGARMVGSPRVVIGTARRVPTMVWPSRKVRPAGGELQRNGAHALFSIYI